MGSSHRTLAEGHISPPRQLSQIGIAATLLAEGTPVGMKALGLSMQPFIQNGDILTITPTTGSLPRPGDIVFYRSPHGRPMVHRVLNLNHSPASTLIAIRGDASTGQPDIVDARDVLGRVVTLTRNGRTIAIDTPLRRTTATVWQQLFPVRWLIKRVFGSETPD